MPEDIALFIDFENIRYSMLNIQRREPDPQELIAVARRYGTVMVARAYADWTRQPEPFKGSLTAAMIDRVDCPAKQRDRIRMGTVHYPSGNTPTGSLGSTAYPGEQGIASLPRSWSSGNTGSLPAITPPTPGNGWSYQEPPLSLENDLDENLPPTDDLPPEEGYETNDYQRENLQQSSPNSSALPYQPSYGQPTPSGPLGQSGTGPLGYANAPHTGNTGHLPAINSSNPNNSGSNTVVQSTVIQSTVDLNMLMDIIETVFDRPTISTFVLMTGDKDFTRISARLKLRLNKTVIVVGIPGTVSRDLISSANQFVPLVPGGNPITMGLPPLTGSSGQLGQPSSSGNTGAMAAIPYASSPAPQYSSYNSPPMDVLDPQFLQFLDYIDRNWSWRTIIGVSNFIGDAVNPKNRFRGRLSRESARELLNTCIQQNILLLQTDATGAEDLRLNRTHPGVDEVLRQFVR
ncbi:MAG: NYN domain-containing protein [Ktedonobacteraceae bacterium]